MLRASARRTSSLMGAKLDGAKVEGVTYGNTILPDGTIGGPTLGTCASAG